MARLEIAPLKGLKRTPDAAPEAAGYAAFQRDVLALSGVLRRRAGSLCFNAADADDLVQDTFEKALRKWTQFEKGTNLRGWLFTMMTNLHYDSIRKKRRHGEVEDDGRYSSALSSQPNQNDWVDVQDLKAAFVHLSPDHQEVLLEGYWQGSQEEAAEAIGSPVGTYKSRANRARKHLRSLLGDSE